MAGFVCKYATWEPQCYSLPTQFEHYCCENELRLAWKNSEDWITMLENIQLGMRISLHCY